MSCIMFVCDTHERISLIVSKVVLLFSIRFHFWALPIFFAGMWFNAAPMEITNHFRAASCQNKIFVVGSMFDTIHSWMVAQVYDAELDSWSLFESPTDYRLYFTLIEHHETLYFICGGDRTVRTMEVSDILTNTWNSAPELPYAFVDPEAIVINDSLIIYNSYENTNALPIMWCEEDKSWKQLTGAKPFEEHLFCTIEDEATIQELQRDLRDPATNFERSPFDV